MKRVEAEVRAKVKDGGPVDRKSYSLDEQVGFLLRQVQQRHTALFAETFENDLTPTQWAVLAKLAEIGECSQNLLGRLTAMDVATIKGVVHRLQLRAFLASRPDPDDRRRLLISLSPEGRAYFEERSARAFAVTEATLAPLSPQQRKTLIELLKQLR
ncbi:MarR family winged helix-turn-helix transcriptional regulator [Lutibaculum baratangense]|uniref:Transcriptional regulator, MarR family n=1 Tax=Lutibaculum baratangense AMV1 TaxID=631454 RepID=V4RA78_9HYPH|nr:MarR family transcriptional regulator [Lutibaculum baratangense]ESR23081.1 Transcriptional regulator, MarR family [Lutibaculum baratangense AMV1]